jgi:hypothetical protein
MNMDAPNQWQPKHRQDGRIIVGIALALAGIFFLLRALHLLPTVFFYVHPGWLALIIIGIVVGVRNNFRNHAWWILIAIGVANIVPSFHIGDVSSRRIFWPSMLIIAGVFMILRKRGPGHLHRHDWHPGVGGGRHMSIESVDTDVVNIDVTFSGRKEIVTSKNFRGGVLRANFSGVELNLSGAESSSTEPMVLDVYASFAGVEIIVPAHWELQNEIRPTLGSVEDNRVIRVGETTMIKPKLILRGSVSFGSVELKSY